MSREVAPETSADTPPPMLVRNEFSIVELSYRRDGNGLSMVVSDADTGQHVVLSAADLAALAACSHEPFRRLLRAIDDHQDNPG